MTDWENYTRLCSMKDSVSSVCNSVQTNAYSNFHHFLFYYPLNFYGEDFVRDLYETYHRIHFNPRINNIELLTDLNDTPRQVQMSGMPMARGHGVSGQVMLASGFPDAIVSKSRGWVQPRTIPVKIRHQFIPSKYGDRYTLKDDNDNEKDKSSLWGKFIRKLTFSKMSDDI